MCNGNEPVPGGAGSFFAHPVSCPAGPVHPSASFAGSSPEGEHLIRPRWRSATFPKGEGLVGGRKGRPYGDGKGDGMRTLHVGESVGLGYIPTGQFRKVVDENKPLRFVDARRGYIRALRGKMGMFKIL